MNRMYLNKYKSKRLRKQRKMKGSKTWKFFYNKKIKIKKNDRINNPEETAQSKNDSIIFNHSI